MIHVWDKVSQHPTVMSAYADLVEAGGKRNRGLLTEGMAETERPGDDAEAQHAALLVAGAEHDTGDDPDGGVRDEFSRDEREGSAGEGEPPSWAPANPAAAGAAAPLELAGPALSFVQRCLRV